MFVTETVNKFSDFNKMSMNLSYISCFYYAICVKQAFHTDPSYCKYDLEVLVLAERGPVEVLLQIVSLSSLGHNLHKQK